MTREEAIKWLSRIDDKYIHGGDEDFDTKRKQALDMAIEALKADTVEVVRCKDCKHLMPDGRCWEFADDAIRPSASDFCSYGERSEE